VDIAALIQDLPPGILDRFGLENSSPDGGLFMKKSKFSESQIAFILRQAEEGDSGVMSPGRDQRGDILQLAACTVG
jgi:hypothetical protein